MGLCHRADGLPQQVCKIARVSDTMAVVAIPPERIEAGILLIRGQRVMIDADLAELYGITTGNLTKAVTRNIERFPEDFAFRLTPEEFQSLLFQFGRANRRGGRRTPPVVFTEHGVAMLSSVLNSPRAVQVNIEIIRAFVRLRALLASHADLAERMDELEAKYDSQFRVVFDAIRELMAPPPAPARELGFKTGTRRQKRDATEGRASKTLQA